MLREQVLYLLELERGQIVTGGELARRLNVSRTAIWKAVAALKKDGNEIEAVPNSGYRMTQNSDGLCGQIIRNRLTTQSLGRSMEILGTVDSTNSYLKNKSTAALPDGHVVVADGQTGGRGRFGRYFYSPKSEGIYLSCLLRPPIPLSDVSFLTICAAVAVCRAVTEACGIRVQVKWVNDIYFGGKKLCGILTEAAVTAELQTVDYAIVGIGVNTGAVASEVEDIATSVLLATGVRGVRNRLICGILNRLEEVYLDFVSRGKRREILAEYIERLFILGERVEVLGHEGYCAGVVTGVDEYGGLLLKNPEGEIIGVKAGEIRILKGAEGC